MAYTKTYEIQQCSHVSTAWQTWLLDILLISTLCTWISSFFHFLVCDLQKFSEG